MADWWYHIRLTTTTSRSSHYCCVLLLLRVFGHRVSSFRFPLLELHDRYAASSAVLLRPRPNGEGTTNTTTRVSVRVGSLVDSCYETDNVSTSHNDFGVKFICTPSSILNFPPSRTAGRRSFSHEQHKLKSKPY